MEKKQDQDIVTAAYEEEAQGQDQVGEAEVVDRGVELPLKLVLTKNKDGQVYHNYKVTLNVFGRPIQIDMRPREGDRNAYEVSDVIFAIVGGNVAPLRCVEMVMKDSSGKNMRYMTYLLTATDPDSGMELSVSLRPQGDSSKRMLENYYKQAIRKKMSAEQF